MFTDDDLIYSYSRAQAIEDGVLVDLNEIAPKACQETFKYPIACTSIVFDIIKSAVENENYDNTYDWIIYDILNMARLYGRNSKSDTILFPVIIQGVRGIERFKRRSKFLFKMVIGPGDTLDPVITIMLPKED